MTIKVLVVDDSGFFRRRLVEMINADPRLSVLDTAVNGAEAVDKVARLKPDVVTMDYEMPVMDGISAVKQLMKASPVPVLMFSSLTYEGARVTLDALEAGAVDYLPKDFEDISRSPEVVQQALCDRIVAVSRSALRASGATTESTTAPIVPQATGRRRTAQHSLLVIGASTGGPMALQKLLTSLPATFPMPIVLVQHMPATFTTAFAERLNRLCAISVCEASEAEVLQPGHAYLVPGGRQAVIERRPTLRLKVIDGDERLHYRPSVDVTLGSAANELGDRVIGVVLTGMGSDGREGARLLKQKGGTVWVQDQQSCVIYGMPMAIARAGLADRELSLDDIGPQLMQEIR